MSSPISLTVGARNLSGLYSDLTFSNVDPGGHEQLTCTLTDTTGIKEGDTATVRCGLAVAWRGRVNEIGARETGGRVTYQLAALGDGARLTDKRIQMIYADRDLTQWTPMSRARRVALVTANINVLDGSQQPDPTSGLPSLNLEQLAPSARQQVNEALYDAHGILIDAIYYNIDRYNVTAAGWSMQFFLGDDADTYQDASVSLSGAAGVTADYYNPATARPFAHLQLNNNTLTADTLTHSAMCRLLVVYGAHGLTRRGSDPGGFYPHDIVGHALTDSGAGFELVAGDSSSLIVGHAVYRDPTPHQTVIADMAKLMGWHWGVWEPRTTLDSTPRLYFTAPPASPTCVITRDAISDLDAPATRVDLLYDTAKVKWADPAGSSGVTTVTISNPLAADAGVSGRVLDLDMGQGDATTATKFGTFALNIALAGARGGGSGTVPDTIKLPGGGSKPACLLKAGRDKIRILDLPAAGSLTADADDRQDTFLVRRVETTVANGLPSTRIEFDGGADLLEVLQARLTLSAFGGGGGSSVGGGGGGTD